MKSMNKQSGFTLIELVMVIVILGILAAAALPKFIDSTGEARQAAVDGVAGALASASAINYAASLAKGQKVGATLSSATATAGIADTESGCDNGVAATLVDGITFAASGTDSYSLSGSAGTYTDVGHTRTCLVTSNDDNTRTANFIITGTK